jgi:hypothetical protein
MTRSMLVKIHMPHILEVACRVYVDVDEEGWREGERVKDVEGLPGNGHVETCHDPFNNSCWVAMGTETRIH